MIHPQKLDGQPIRVFTLPDGRVFVDVVPEYGDGHIINRGGPDYPRHFCRFEDYGLADGLVRCKKCGLVVPQEGNVNPYVPQEYRDMLLDQKEKSVE